MVLSSHLNEVGHHHGPMGKVPALAGCMAVTQLAAKAKNSPVDREPAIKAGTTMGMDNLVEAYHSSVADSNLEVDRK